MGAFSFAVKDKLRTKSQKSKEKKIGGCKYKAETIGIHVNVSLTEEKIHHTSQLMPEMKLRL